MLDLETCRNGCFNEVGGFIEASPVSHRLNPSLETSPACIYTCSLLNRDKFSCVQCSCGVGVLCASDRCHGIRADGVSRGSFGEP